MVDQVELVERVARALCQHSGRGHDDDWESYTTSARAALEASHHAELVDAAATVFASAERPGSRAEYVIGPDGEETWHDYQEVSQPALDKLATVLAKVRTPTTPERSDDD